MLVSLGDFGISSWDNSVKQLIFFFFFVTENRPLSLCIFFIIPNFQFQHDINYKSAMISSIRYKSKSRISQSSTFIPNRSFIFEILIIKGVILTVLFILPPLMNEEILSILVTVLIAVDFWSSKNLGRKFLSVCWYINTEGQEDEWVYQASLKSPTETYQALFWYSFLMFGILLVVMGILSIVVGKLSLVCAILIGFVANYINFYAFSNIIQMRNQGVLQMISDQVQGEGVGQTIKLPLLYVSKLQEIPQQNSMESVQ